MPVQQHDRRTLASDADPQANPLGHINPAQRETLEHDTHRRTDVSPHAPTVVSPAVWSKGKTFPVGRSVGETTW